MLSKKLWGLLAMLLALPVQAQVDEDQNGMWYVYQWSQNPNPAGIGWQGDFQHRNWDSGGDIEQLLLRGGVSYTPKGSAIRYTLGLAYVHSEAFGASTASTIEKRIYQEASMPQRLGKRGFLTHRLRLEQRDLEGQDLRTRLRYLLGINVPLNQEALTKGALYLALQNELFVNLERGLGRGRSVEYFDRNRAYVGLGYSLSDTLRLQVGYLEQTLDATRKGQFQLNWIQSF